MLKIFSGNGHNIRINFNLIDLFDEWIFEQLPADSPWPAADTQHSLTLFFQKKHRRMNHRFAKRVFVGRNILYAAIQKQSASVTLDLQNFDLIKF